MLKKFRLKRTGLVILTIIGLAVLPAVSTQAACPDDIFARWPMDETAPVPGDSGGVYVDAVKGNDGAGNVNPTPVTGRVGGAQLFTSALPNPTKVNVPADNSFDWQANEDFSIEFWMKTDSGIPTSNQVIVGRPYPSGEFWWVGIRGGSATASQNGKAAFTLRDAGGAGNNIPGGGTVNLADGGWHHVVAIRDTAQDKIILYVDGATADSTSPNPLEAEDLTTTTVGTAGFESTRALNIGWLNESPFYHFDGVVDEVALYDRVLSDTEILAHYNAGLNDNGVESLRPEPLADAGTDQTVQRGATVTLDGGNSADTPPGAIVGFLWEQLAGTGVTLSSTTSETATFTAPTVDGVLTFRLTVTDNDGLVDTATVNVTINDSGVAPPVTPPASGGGGGGGGCFISTMF